MILAGPHWGDQVLSKHVKMVLILRTFDQDGGGDGITPLDTDCLESFQVLL